ncbi:MAG: adenosylcobinamide-GDP ribazoletransferase [Oscillospiraceae bacterium]|nr:adenosylcobinamide-GDP ribazoletransferase [Oscillospiraceae bacterium]
MKRLITGFFMSWGMFCAIPCPLKRWDEKAKGLMLLMLPLIGAMIGALWALAAFLLCMAALPGLMTAGLLTVIPYLLTGFIHLDGYMDCCDAILSRRDIEERRRILKDSHTGAFAVIALTVVVLLSFSFLTGLSDRTPAWCLIFLPAASRCVSALGVMSLSPMPGSSYEKVQPEVSNGCRAGAWFLLVAAAVLPMLLFGWTGLCAVVTMAVSALAMFRGRSQLGGMNGDISGFAITLGECAGICALVLLSGGIV